MSDNFLPLSGPDSPPMANGEITFEAPWQSRTFGMAQALCLAGHYSWDEFREVLIAGIRKWEIQHQGKNVEFQYFDIFLDSLMQLLSDRGLLQSDAIRDRVDQYTARPHGHDHRH
jgi:nitrile hydratase accessory protein